MENPQFFSDITSAFLDEILALSKDSAENFILDLFDNENLLWELADLSCKTSSRSEENYMSSSGFNDRTSERKGINNMTEEKSPFDYQFDSVKYEMFKEGLEHSVEIESEDDDLDLKFGATTPAHFPAYTEMDKAEHCFRQNPMPVHYQPFRQLVHIRHPSTVPNTYILEVKVVEFLLPVTNLVPVYHPHAMPANPFGYYQLPANYNYNYNHY